jgi:hypothetical protein
MALGNQVVLTLLLFPLLLALICFFGEHGRKQEEESQGVDIHSVDVI